MRGLYKNKMHALGYKKVTFIVGLIRDQAQNSACERKDFVLQPVATATLGTCP